eukprot:TRINITY_DN10096_c0_g1_i1.p1 TRINITY_DN10096_c0_g1~~TRINITY_DN10096_c0_g1_i1.p1  ORF type:complete len:1652 (+),score=286.83 TRINITY_DN10096_c0_g1_i1:113-4957(+)
MAPRKPDYSVDGGEASMFEVVRQLAAKAGHVVAAIDGLGGVESEVAEAKEGSCVLPPAKRLTYAELCTAAERIAWKMAQLLRDGSTKDIDGRPASEEETLRRYGMESAIVATWMRRGNPWYCVFLASAHLQASVVALSSDLPDKKTEHIRNTEILDSHRPWLLVADETAKLGETESRPTEELQVTVPSSTRILTFRDLWSRAWAEDHRHSPSLRPSGALSADATLCFSYTGGTTKASRCARVTHKMAIHEVSAYPRVAPEVGCEDRVLQQHSLYWAASAYGEVDIALAFGCALVFCEAWDTDGMVSAIREHEATVSGIVPSMLAALEHSDVPSLRLVFTWGEALQPKVARMWARTLHLIDLLISTECWLSLYADWSADGKAVSADDVSAAALANGVSEGVGDARKKRDKPPFCVLSGATIRLRPVDNGSDAEVCHAGELLISGPMVSPGYTDKALNADAFITDADNLTWYCTRDCLERSHEGGGLFFTGRADDLVKVGGVWLDSREVEARLAVIDGVCEVIICSRNVYVTLEAPMMAGTLPKLRSSLPQDFTLFVVPAPLPRNASTGKVDRKRLAELSFVCSNDEHLVAHWENERRICLNELENLLRWYRPLCGLGAASLIHAIPAVGGACAVFSAPSLVIPLGLRTLAELTWRLPALSFMVLYSWHSSPKLLEVLSYAPMGYPGAALAAACVLPNPLCGLVVAGPGVYMAAKRRRLTSWPLVSVVGFPFWSREAWEYQVRNGFGTTLRWHVDNARQQMRRLVVSGRRRGVAAYQKVKLRCKAMVGLAKRCNWCNRFLPRSTGEVRKTVAPDWYCDRCWGLWERHRECKVCARWFVSQHNEVCDSCRVRSSNRTGTGSGSSSSSSSSSSSGCRAEGTSASQSQSADNWPRKRSLEWRTIWYPCDTVCSGGGSGHRGEGRPHGRRRRRLVPQRTTASSTADSSDDVEEPRRLRRRVLSPQCSFHENGLSGATNGDVVTTNGNANGVPTDNGAITSTSSGENRTGPTSHSVNEDRSCTEPQGSPRRPSRLVTLQERTREWKIIEQATNITFQSKSDSLACLDSLRHTKLTSSLRRETGKRLPRQALKRAACLGDLLEEISRLPVEVEAEELQAPRFDGGTATGRRRAQQQRRAREQQQKGMAGVQGEFGVWGLMWSSKCQWFLLRRRPLSEEVLRAALTKLVERHVALRAELRDPYRLFLATQQAFTVQELWRRYSSQLSMARSAEMAALRVFGPRGSGALKRVTSFVAKTVGSAVRWSFRNSWPRAGARQGHTELPLDVRDRQPTLEDAEREAWKFFPDGFKPPFTVVFVPYGDLSEEEPEGALVRIAVTHMLSDGYSSVPLFSDLAHLVAAEEAARGEGVSADEGARRLAAPLPAVPSMFATMEERLGGTIDGSREDGGITRDPLRRRWTRQAHTVFAKIPAEIVCTIRQAAHRIAVPEDIAMLTLICTTLAWFQERESVLIAMIVPQRDGPSENDMVGLFADARHLIVHTGGLNFAGAALRLQHAVKERRWQAPGLATQSDVPFVNFEWTDFEECQGFAQHVSLMETEENARHPLKVSVEQPDKTSWRMSVGFSLDRYYERDRKRFFALFDKGLFKLFERPLDDLWACDGGDK